MSRFIEGYTPVSSAKSISQSTKSALSELKKGIVGNTVTTSYPVGDRGSQALSGSVNNGKLVEDVRKAADAYFGKSSSSGSGGGYGGGGGSASVSSSEADPYERVYQLIKETSQANNEWSAAQAQKQMDFEREMSNTAHVREVADLKAAGLNPVLSAGGSGASTPSGAMGQTDTSNTRLVAEVAMEAMNAMAQSASGIAGAARSMASNDNSFLGKIFGAYANNKLVKKVVDTGINLAGQAIKYKWLGNAAKAITAVRV